MSTLFQSCLYESLDFAHSHAGILNWWRPPVICHVAREFLAVRSALGYINMGLPFVQTAHGYVHKSFPSFLLGERGEGREEFEESHVAPFICPFEGSLWWLESMSPFRQLVLEWDLRAEGQEAAKMLVPREIIGDLTSSPLAIPLHRMRFCRLIRAGLGSWTRGIGKD